MRRMAILSALFIVWGAHDLLGQTIDFTTLVTDLDPSLSVTYTPIAAAPVVFCDSSTFGPGLGGPDCLGPTPTHGTDSAGGLIVAYCPNRPPLCPAYWGGSAEGTLARFNSGAAESLAILNLRDSTGPNQVIQFAVTPPWIDLVQGTLTVIASGTMFQYDPTTTGCSTIASEQWAMVTITGLPKLFDTLLTFVPGGQTLTALTPGLPDGFRTADSLQVWTGSVKTLPDWSQASPLACSAAAGPTPGLMVSVNDILPDPDLGMARYYVVASQSGTQRRLGRQYVNGADSARDPSTLPTCAH